MNKTKKVLLIMATVILLAIAAIFVFTFQYAPGPDDSINGRWRLVQMGPSLDEMKDLPRNFMEMTISDGSYEQVSFEKDGSIKPDSTERGPVRKDLFGGYSKYLGAWADANIIVKTITAMLIDPSEDIRKEGNDRIIIHIIIPLGKGEKSERYLCYERIED
jgi:hypothetical protein